jgi:hypothetical protein
VFRSAIAILNPPLTAGGTMGLWLPSPNLKHVAYMSERL